MKCKPNRLPDTGGIHLEPGTVPPHANNTPLRRFGHTNVTGSTQGNIHIECLPYDADDEQIYTTADNEGVEYLNVPNRVNGRKSFWECVNEVPEVASAMDAIIAAIPALREWINTPPPPPDPPN